VTLPWQSEALQEGHGADRKTAYPWPFFVVMASAFLLFFSLQAVFPVSPLYIVEVGGSSADNGLATWVFTLAALLIRPLTGILSDRWGRKPALVLGAVLFSSGPVFHAFASNVPLLLVAKALHGIGLGCFSTAYQAFVADLLPPNRYGEGLGVAGIAPSLAMVVAPLFGESMVATFDFRRSFFVFGAIGGLGSLTTLVLPGRNSGSAQDSSAEGGSLWEALRRPGVRAGSLGMALLGMPFGAFISFLPLLASARGLGGVGLVFAVYALTGALARPVAGRATDRWGARRVVLLGLLVTGLTMAALAFATGRWALLGLAAIMGIGGAAASTALDTKVQMSVGHSLRGSASALQYTAFDTLVGFGSLGFGFLAEATDYGVMYGAVGIVVLFGVLVAGLCWPRIRQRV
jgi:MFS family permease